jgi:hypothetical protein
VLNGKYNRLRGALLEIRGLHSVNALVLDIVERALKEEGSQ